MPAPPCVRADPALSQTAMNRSLGFSSDLAPAEIRCDKQSARSLALQAERCSVLSDRQAGKENESHIQCLKAENFDRLP
jgi:hypothetical protein